MEKAGNCKDRNREDFRGFKGYFRGFREHGRGFRGYLRSYSGYFRGVRDILRVSGIFQGFRGYFWGLGIFMVYYDVLGVRGYLRGFK